MHKFIGLGILLLLTLSQLSGQKLPKFELNDIHGDTFSTNNLLERQSLIVITHIGCGPGMQVFKDLQDFADTLLNDSIDVYLVLENTEEQFLAFTADSGNHWSTFRKYFQLDREFPFSVVAECKKPHKKYSNPQTGISYQCRGLKRKFKSSSSPTIILTDPKQGVVLKDKGYTLTSNPSKINRYREFLHEVNLKAKD